MIIYIYDYIYMIILYILCREKEGYRNEDVSIVIRIGT